MTVDCLARYRAALKRFDLAALRAIVFDMLAMEELVLPHPDYPDVVTTCRSSRRHGLSNLLFFSDDQRERRWCLVQSMDFMEAAVTENTVLSIHRREQTWETQNAADLFRNGTFDAQFKRNDTFGGAMLSSNRPFHFFYDQLIHLPHLAAPLTSCRTLTVGNSFVEPSGHGNWRLMPVRDDRYYLLINPAGAFRLKGGLGNARFGEYAAEMERRVEAAALELPPPFPPEMTTLWIGITGQKRSWLEQVEGYTAIINEVARISRGVGVFIDGLTAPAGERTSVPEDERVAAAIRERLRPEVQVVSLVGLDYATKIGHCRHADAFIANGGTGCLVPLRFCRKPGVVHSNSKMQFFADDLYENVAFVEDRWIVEEAGPNAAATSYHIAWQRIHNLLAGVLQAIDLPAPELLPEPKLETTSPT